MALNAADTPAELTLRLPFQDGRLVDLLNPGAEFRVQNSTATVLVPANWAVIAVSR